MSDEERSERESRSAILDALPDGIMVVDVLGVVRFVNRAAEELLEKSQEELLTAAFAFPLAGDAAFAVELSVGGHPHEIELRKSPIDWEGERAVLVSLRDVTEHGVLRERRRRVEELEALGRLAGGVAHDFNNLLTGIMTFTSLVRDTLDPHDERRDDLAQVLASGKRAVELTRNLLAFSRREPSTPHAADLNQLIGNLSARLERRAGGRVDVEKRLSPALWPVLLDGDHFEQILTNLVDNARDAMPAGGTLCIETRNDTDPVLGDCVLCRISDSGHGMTEEVKKNLFHPFFTTKAPGAGTGLGLATVYGLLLQAKGTVEVDSVLGRGARFDLRFPRAAPGSASMRPSMLSYAGAARGPSGSEGILLAEDEPIVRQSVSRMLRRGGYTYFEARNGKEALEVFSEHESEIRLALLDVVMPELSGPETAMRLRARNPSIKILFMSGYPRDLFDTNEEARGLGPLIQKPMSEAALLAAIRRVLDAHAVEPSEP